MDFIKEVFFSEVNIGLSILLLLVVIYWIFAIITGLDTNIDTDIDVDIDVGAEADLGSSESVDFEDITNAEAKDQAVRKKGKLNWFQIFLIYFNFVGLPLMFTFTFWVLIWWTITVTGTYLTGTYDNNIGFLFFFGAMIPALYINKMVTSPFKRLFKKFNSKGDQSIDLLGRAGISLSQLEGERIGTVEVKVLDSPIKFYAKSLDGSLINSGEQILVIKQSSDKKYYYVQPYTNYS